MSPWLTSSRQFVELTTRYDRDSDRTVKPGFWPAPGTLRTDARNATVKSQFMYSRVTPKEFMRVDHPRQRCSLDERAEADCEIDCFQNMVVSVSGCK